MCVYNFIDTISFNFFPKLYQVHLQSSIEMEYIQYR